MDLVNLIRLTHGAGLNAAIEASYESEESAEYEASMLMAALYVDDTFNEYTEAELQAAIAEAINEN